MSEQTISYPPPHWLSPLIEQVKVIDKCLTIEEAKRALSALRVDAKEVLRAARLDPRFYTRTSVWCTEYLEVLIMGWLPGQMSPLHNHKGSICAVQVLAGEALEVGYEKSEPGYLSPLDLAKFPQGSIAVSEDEEIHQFGNASSNPMVSLHLYSPPLTLAETFPETASILTTKSFASMRSQGKFVVETWVNSHI